jgi:hypothetical protein
MNPHPTMLTPFFLVLYVHVESTAGCNLFNSNPSRKSPSDLLTAVPVPFSLLFGLMRYIALLIVSPNLVRKIVRGHFTLARVYIQS